ncbi:alpha/beta hydrolase family esterase [Herbaspirillum sp. NPDC101396]|uniref:extracellular catalytic domain type 1 short-chain-length polyhydroxyalkanoate depolymerase n=1 Tax=Herbaspirillum sp. NPDC101396 TaxID=3364005 RepID=UPI00383AE2DE
MSQLGDLQARMAEITRRLNSDGAGKTTQVIQDALAAAGLKPPSMSAGTKQKLAPQNFVSDLLGKLGLGGAATTPQADTQAPDLNGGKFVAGSYANTAGSRRYKVYVPSGYDGEAMPLVVMLHGCTQDPDDFARGTQMNALAEEQGFLVVYPAQEASDNSSKCWNWFKAMDQQRDQGEPSLIAGITNEVINQYGLDRKQVFVAGLSAGGAMAIIMGSTYPDLYQAVGVHSGLPYASASDLTSALSAMRGASGTSLSSSRRGGASAKLQAIPVIVFHGDRDATVSPSNGTGLIDDFVARFEQTAASEEKISTVVEEGKTETGHRYSRTSLHVDGRPVLAEHWLIHGAGHAWAGGSARGSYTDANGPDASREMLRFFSTQRADSESLQD